MEGWKGRGPLALAFVLVVAIAGWASMAASSAHIDLTPPASQPLRAAPTLDAASARPVAVPDAAPGSRYAFMKAITVGSAPASVAYDAAKGETFVANSNSDNVSVISDATSTVVATIPVGLFPYGVAYDPARSELFVANLGSDNVSVISDATNQVVASVALSAGDWPAGIVYDSGIGAIFVANAGSDSIAEISDATNAVNNTVFLGTGTVPFGLAYDSGLGQIFVSLRGTGEVAVVVDTSLAHATIPVGQTPMGVAYDAARSEIYVANNGSGTVSVIADVNESVVATIPIGSNPVGVAYAPGTGELAVTYRQSFPPDTFGMLGILADANHTVLTSVGLYAGGSPVAVSYDPARKAWYVADSALGLVEIVARGYPVTFTEAGLPAGTLWTLWLNGTNGFGAFQTQVGSTVATADVVVANGTYTFAVPRAGGFTPSPASGSITVAGAAVSQPIAFAFLYLVTFTETGLPAGTNWTVTFAGTTRSSSTATLTFSAANGSFAFTVGAVNGYSASPGSGNVTVSGTAASQTIAFAAPSSSPPDTTLLIVGAAVLVAAVAAVALLLLRRRRKTPPPSSAPPKEPGTPP
jgi:YVTN family beta-propeller protein